MSALSTQHSALSTQHSALSTQHARENAFPGRDTFCGFARRTRTPPSFTQPENECRHRRDIAHQPRTNPLDRVRRSRNCKRPRDVISFRCVSVVAAARDALRQYRPQSFRHEGNT
ncbi:hypothetical protein FPJ27_13420 [Burkholderia sp. MS455]|nr:hypothetical protein FPJ27_13420 [Burkholderia sp. MS455]